MKVNNPTQFFDYYIEFDPEKEILVKEIIDKFSSARIKHKSIDDKWCFWTVKDINWNSYRELSKSGLLSSLNHYEDDK